MDRRTFSNFVAASLFSPPLFAQPRSRPSRIGFLSPREAPPPPLASDIFFAQFLPALRQLGYVVGENVVIDARWGANSSGSLAKFADELVRVPVDVIVSQGPVGLSAAAKATRAVPIVMVNGSSDPVGEGYASSLARPGGNITGLAYAASPERFQKELEYLKEAVPAMSRVAVAWDLADMTQYARTIKGPLERAARNLGLTILPPVQVPDAGSVDAAFAAIRAQRVDALLILIVGSARSYRDAIAAAAIAQRLPTVAAFRFMVEGGVLMSYGPDEASTYRRAAYYVDRILKGAKPAELPIELPLSDQLTINLRTARAIGLTIPQPLLLRADVLIQ